MFRRTLAIFATAAVAASGLLGLQLIASSPTSGGIEAAAAADASGFDPGNLISDEVFFTGAALSAGQIQTFLNSKVTTCAATDGPACLRDYRQTTPDRPADAYCTAYSGQENELASSIIAKVSKSCGVSAKVLLVLLQKEQSLVTSTAPSERQYRSATGFACPDTAPCNAQY